MTGMEFNRNFVGANRDLPVVWFEESSVIKEAQILFEK